MRGAAERDERRQPAMALGGDPDDRHFDGRDLLSEGTGGGLRFRPRLRILLHRTAAPSARRGRLADQSAGDQVGGAEWPNSSSAAATPRSAPRTTPRSAPPWK